VEDEAFAEGEEGCFEVIEAGFVGEVEQAAIAGRLLSALAPARSLVD